MADQAVALEKEIAGVVARFHRDEQGREPASVAVTVLPDMIVVRSFDVFTATERDLATSDEGKKAIQSARRDQRAMTRRQVQEQVAQVVGQPIVRSFYDIDTRVGEQVEVFILSGAPAV